MINESELDDTVPVNFLLLFYFICADFEFIYFELKINCSLYAYMLVYKSPRLKDELFLNATHDFIVTRDAKNTPTFLVIGLSSLDTITATLKKGI